MPEPGADPCPGDEKQCTRKRTNEAIESKCSDEQQGGNKRRRLSPPPLCISLPSSSSTCRLDLAQRKLRRFFVQAVRTNGTQAVARRFCENCLESVGNYEEVYAKSRTKESFEELSKKLKGSKFIHAAGDMLLRILHMCNHTEKKRESRPLITGVVSVRLFLSSYLIAARPDEIFTNIDGDLEERVFKASGPMIACCHRMAMQLADGRPWHAVVTNGECKDLPNLLCLYLRRFKCWKIEGEKQLAGR